MDAEEVLRLYESCWFELQIFKKQPSSSTSQASESNPVDKIKNSLDLPRVPSMHKRSMSDQQVSCKTSFDDYSRSPDSVLLAPKIQTILSGKETSERDIKQRHSLNPSGPSKKTTTRRKRRAKGGKGTKSLTDLEFEELKGLMDLGFVFTDEDKDSSLARIIPALQRLGKDDGEVASDESNDSTVSRPYLSEAWEVLDRRRSEEKQLKSWRIPKLSTEIDMKDNLRWWAHTVASTVR